MSTILELLEQSYELIRLPENWCQRISMRRLGECYFEIGPQRYSFCASGAVWAVTGHSQRQQEVLSAINVLLSPNDVISYNDNHRHWQVLRLWRLAIANLKAGGIEARAQHRRIRQQVIAMRKEYTRVLVCG